MTTATRLALSLLPLGLLACDKGVDEPGSPDSGARYGCEEVVSELDPSEAPFGVSGTDFLAALPPQLVGVADFEQGASSELEVELSVEAASLRLVESNEVDSGGSGPVPAIDVYCADRLEVDAQLRLVSADGQLAEELAVVVSFSDDADLMDGIQLAASLDADALGGSLDLADYTDPTRFDFIDLDLMARIADGLFEGEVTAVGTAESGQVVSAELIPIAQLAADSEG